MKYGEGPGEAVVHGPERPHYATGEVFIDLETYSKDYIQNLETGVDVALAIKEKVRR